VEDWNTFGFCQQFGQVAQHIAARSCGAVWLRHYSNNWISSQSFSVLECEFGCALEHNSWLHKDILS
jgi:hypothetical protein